MPAKGRELPGTLFLHRRKWIGALLTSVVVAAIIPWGTGRAETQAHAGPEVTPSDQHPGSEAVFLVRADGSSGTAVLRVAPAAVGSTGVPGEGFAALEPILADYRTRAEDGRIEFLTPALIRALNSAPPDSSVAGAAPWEWQRYAALQGRVVAIQIVPDLRWTTGSGFRVTGRVVSYPVLAGIQVGLVLVVAFVALLGGSGDIPPPILPAALWKPARAAYHFKGDFEAARLLRGEEEIAPIDGERLCGTSKVWLARKPGQKPRWRKVNGCWGTYTFPAEAFRPGAPVELRMFEEGKKDGPRTVAVPEELAARIWSDFHP